LFLAFATWLQLSLGLRPLIRLRQEVVDAIDGRRRRLSLDAPSEVQSLAHEVDALLDTQERELEPRRRPCAWLEDPACSS
jgi:hypothetical protein